MFKIIASKKEIESGDLTRACHVNSDRLGLDPISERTWRKYRAELVSLGLITVHRMPTKGRAVVLMVTPDTVATWEYLKKRGMV